MRRLVTALLGFTTAVGLSMGCSQSEGDYCQVDNDCRGGLTCVRATNTCQRPGVGTTDGGEIDAAVDARSDATPTVDAAVDAPIDAP